MSDVPSGFVYIPTIMIAERLSEQRPCGDRASPARDYPDELKPRPYAEAAGLQSFLGSLLGTLRLPSLALELRELILEVAFENLVSRRSARPMLAWR